MRRLTAVTYLPVAARAVLAAIVAAVSSILLVYFLMSVFVAAYPLLGRGDATSGQVAAVGWLVGAAGTPAIFSVLTFGGAYQVVRRGSQRPGTVGALVGLLGAGCALGVIELAYGGADLWEVPVYAIAGCAAGWGGAQLALHVLGWERGFMQAARMAGAALEPAALPRALGLSLKPLGASAAVLWTTEEHHDSSGRSENVLRPQQTPRGAQVGARPWYDPSRGSPRRAVLWSAASERSNDAQDSIGGDASTPGAAHPLERAASLAASRMDRLADVGQRELTTVRRAELDPAGRSSWSSWGIRSALVIPLATSSLEPLGVLAVALRSRRPPAGIASRAFPAFVTTAGLALHNMLLVKRASQAATLEERQRFQLDIHDTIAQDLTGVERALQVIDEGPLSDTVREQLRIALRAARSGARQARALIDGATDLDAGELPKVLARLAAACAADTQADIEFRGVGPTRNLDRAVEVALLRVAQEALNNVRKHACARHVEIVLTYAETLVTLQVKDDGAGFDQSPRAAATAGGRGLVGMHERMQGVGGSLFVGSTSGKGTRLLAQIPTDR